MSPPARPSFTYAAAKSAKNSALSAAYFNTCRHTACGIIMFATMSRTYKAMLQYPRVQRSHLEAALWNVNILRSRHVTNGALLWSRQHFKNTILCKYVWRLRPSIINCVRHGVLQIYGHFSNCVRTEWRLYCNNWITASVLNPKIRLASLEFLQIQLRD